MNDDEFSAVNELLHGGMVYESIRHGAAILGNSVFEWHLNFDFEHEWVLVSYKNGGAWNDDCCADAVDEVLVNHLVNLVQKKHSCQVPFKELDLNPSAQFSAAAVNLFRDHRFLSLVRENVQKFHVGDEPVTELLVLSVASLSVTNTKGLQPKLSGESGMGKTHSTKTVLHLMHPTMYRAASFSSKALFYDDTLRSKMVIFSDDVNLAPEVEETVRAAMTNWDSSTEHITLDGKRNPVKLSLPRRIAFWLTSVSTKSTIQLLNRQVEMNVDESHDQNIRVEQHQRRLAEAGLPEFYEDNEVELLREAFLHINRLDFKVKIPFIENIRFTDVRNRRNFPIFLDFVKAHCVLNYRDRETDDDGSLIATKQDFDNALELFKTVAVQQVTKLNKREREIAGVIKAHSPCDVATVMDETGLSRSRISELLHGDRDSGNRGLLEKIPELKYHSRREAPPEGCVWGRSYYALPEDWSIVSSYEAIVYWDDDLIDANQLRGVSESFGDDFRNSKKPGKGLDSKLKWPNADISDNTDTSFGTSEEYDTNSLRYSTAHCRSPETTRSELPINAAEPVKTAEEIHKATNSISEARSEVERNTRENDATALSFKADSSLSQDRWQPKMIVPRRIGGRWVTFVKMKGLANVPTFVGTDGDNYRLSRNDVLLLPEANAKVLWLRKLAVFVED